MGSKPGVLTRGDKQGNPRPRVLGGGGTYPGETKGEKSRTKPGNLRTLKP